MLTNNIADITEKLMRSRASKLENYVKRTPTVTLSSEKLKKYLSGSEIYMKLECMQHTGTFKARGAISVALEIPKSKSTTV